MEAADLERLGSFRREREVYEDCSDDYGYLCLVLRPTAAGPTLEERR